MMFDWISEHLAYIASPIYLLTCNHTRNTPSRAQNEYNYSFILFVVHEVTK